MLIVNYTVANLLITDVFPKETQALAGAVYQTMSQLGISIGIAVLAVISNTTTDASPVPDKGSPEALMQGFRAVFWTCFAMMVLSTIVGLWGLQGYKKIGSANETKNAAPSLPKCSKSPPKTVDQHPAMPKRKSFPPKPASRAKPELRFALGHSRILEARNKPLPDLPPGYEPSTAFEMQPPGSVVSTPNSDAGLMNDYFSERHNASQASFTAEDDILNEYLSDDKDYTREAAGTPMSRCVLKSMSAAPRTDLPRV